MMRFLFDAQLPRKIAWKVEELGYKTLHTLDLPQGNRTKDSQINALTLREKRVLVSKDADFVESLIVSDKPYKLLFVNTGNITNRELETLLLAHWSFIVEAFEESRYIELTRSSIIVHQ